MRLVAFDLSLTRTGLAIATDHPSAGGDITTGTVEVDERGVERLDALSKLLTAAALAADVAIIEGYSYNSRSKGEQLGELGGVVRLALYRAGISYVEIAPAKMKKYATGAGNAAKEQVMAAAARRADRDFACSDESDAWWLLQMAIARYMPEHPAFVVMPAVNQQALRDIAWPDIPAKETAA